MAVRSSCCIRTYKCKALACLCTVCCNNSTQTALREGACIRLESSVTEVVLVKAARVVNRVCTECWIPGSVRQARACSMTTALAFCEGQKLHASKVRESQPRSLVVLYSDCCRRSRHGFRVGKYVCTQNPVKCEGIGCPSVSLRTKRRYFASKTRKSPPLPVSYIARHLFWSFAITSFFVPDLPFVARLRTSTYCLPAQPPHLLLAHLDSQGGCPNVNNNDDDTCPEV